MAHPKASGRGIDKIILHCSATPPTQDIGAGDIRRWHKARGWADIGYHYVIRRDGSLEVGRDEAKVGAHVKGHNQGSLGICLVGGTTLAGEPMYNFTGAQMVRLKALMRTLMARHKSARVHGHNEFSDKACPTFDVQVWAEEVLT